MERGQRANRPPLPTDAIELRIKYHNPALLRRALVDAASNLRDKALITFLAQTGQRIGVVTSLRLRHVNLDEPSSIVVEIPAILRNNKGFNVNKAQTVYHFVFGEDTVNYLRLRARVPLHLLEPMPCLHSLIGEKVSIIRTDSMTHPLVVRGMKSSAQEYRCNGRCRQSYSDTRYLEASDVARCSRYNQV